MASNPMGPGKLRGWVDFIAGIPVATTFKAAVTILDTLIERVPFAKTDVTARTALLLTSNETTNAAGLSVALTGGAAQANRSVTLQTTEIGISNAGTLSLQPLVGTTALGPTTTSGSLVATQPATGTTTAKIVTIVGSTVNGFEVDASAITNGLKWVWDKFHHVTATQAAVPTQTLNTGAGTGPTNTGCLAGSNDQYGKVQWTQGTGAPAANTTIMSVAFKNAYVTAPISVQLQSASANTNNGLLIVANITVNGFDILNGATQATVATGTAAVTYRVN